MPESAALTEGLENLDMKAVARVAEKAILEEIILFDAQINRDPLGMPPKELTLEHNFSTKILPYEKDKTILSVLCNFRVAAFSRKSPDKIIMNIEASFCTSYVLKPIGDFDPDDIEHFSKINPIYNTWAYWREFVQSMTTRMGFPALTVPLLKILPKKSAAKEVKGQAVKRESARRKKLSA